MEARFDRTRESSWAQDTMRWARRVVHAMTTGFVLTYATIVTAEFPGAANQRARPTADVQSKKVENVNDFIQRFPRDVKGIGKYEEKIHEGAEVALINVRNRHWTDEESPATVRRIERCQWNIYDAICDLRDRKLLTEVFEEGEIVPGDPEPIPDPPQRRGFIRAQDVSSLVLNGAVRELDFYKKIRLLPAERTKTLDNAGRALLRRENMSERQYNQWLYEDRENAFLKIIVSGIAKPRDPRRNIAFTVWGGDHNFENNIEEWNKTHTSNKFSLLTLTPKSILQSQRNAMRNQRLPSDF